jgi:hypothetical protein
LLEVSAELADESEPPGPSRPGYHTDLEYLLGDVDAERLRILQQMYAELTEKLQVISQEITKEMARLGLSVDPPEAD